MKYHIYIIYICGISGKPIKKHIHAYACKNTLPKQQYIYIVLSQLYTIKKLIIYMKNLRYVYTIFLHAKRAYRETT